MRLCRPWLSSGSRGGKTNHGTGFRDFCISSSCAEAARRLSCVNDVTVPRDAIICEAGLGPACNTPSCRIETSEKGEVAALSSRSRSFGCKPSPRKAVNALNLFEEVISGLPCLALTFFSLNRQQRVATPISAFELTSLFRQARRWSLKLRSGV